MQEKTELIASAMRAGYNVKGWSNGRGVRLTDGRIIKRMSWTEDKKPFSSMWTAWFLV